MVLSSKIALITGGAGGLGKAFAKVLLANGAKVCVADLNTEAGEKYVDDLLAEFPEKAIFVQCDVTNDESFKRCFEACKEKLGEANLLINNAGCANEQNWQQGLNVNLGGTIRGTQLAIELMGKNNGHNGGHVVNMSSIAGLKCIPFGPYYAASKAGIVHYSRSVGHEFNVSYTGVSVQCMCPSLVETPFIDNVSRNAWSPQAGAGAVAMVDKMSTHSMIMKVEKVSDALVQILKEGKTGDVMVIEQNKDPYYVESSLS